jgi:hypothetical protein
MAANQVTTQTDNISIGDLKLVIGTYANASGSTGGTIYTGLKEIFYFEMSNETSQATEMNKTAISGGVVTVTATDNEDGHWLAIGA